ncbi:hypothetical protein Tco_0023280 [Tanacetum coccineum]
MMSDHNSSDLAPQRQMASAENNTSGPVPQFKFKAGSKSCSSSSQDSYIMTRVGITIPPSYSNAEDNRPHSSMFKRRLIAADQASVFMAMTSDHNRSELGIQDHNNEQSSSKLVPKVVP